MPALREMADGRRAAEPPAARWWGSLGNLLVSIFARDLKTKVIALACAILIWFFVSGQLSDRVELVVPVTIEVVSERTGETATLFADSGEQKHLQVTLEGPRDAVRVLSAEGVSAVYRIGPGRLPPGENKANLEVPAEVFLDLPAGVRVVTVEPRHVSVFVQRVRLKTVQVRAKVEGDGKVAPGYHLLEITLTPSEVQVFLPAAIADRDYVWSTPIPIEGRKESFSQTVAIAPRLENLRVYPASNQPILAQVRIEEDLVAREVPLEVLVLRPNEYPLRVKEVFPKTVLVRVEGPRTLVGDSRRWKAYFDIRDVPLATIRRELGFAQFFPLRVDVPDGVKVLETLERSGGSLHTITKVDVEFTGE
ncbi:MAG: hypothetical protein HY720_30460 [Planctomycetes bacterium]|nr:hypothetical protein [Planctomycetota bacterium]